MKTNKLLIVSVLAVALLGCGKREPKHIVILPDVSGSIDRESLEQAFKAIDDLAGHLQRGDRLTIIPILGDAEAETSGRILRFVVPASRQAYDTDLREFRSKLNASLREMQAEAIARPGSKTDILGAIALAEQDFHATSSEDQRLLFILTDLIEDDREFNFSKDGRLDNVGVAAQFAESVARKGSLHFYHTRLYCGLLRSNEYVRLSNRRRITLKTFWIRYFQSIGTNPELISDGPSLFNDRGIR